MNDAAKKLWLLKDDYSYMLTIQICQYFNEMLQDPTCDTEA